MDLEKEGLYEEALEEIVEDLGLWTKEECFYLEESPIQLSSRGLKCATCYFFQEEGACGAVQGPVNSEAFCRFWVSKSAEKEEQEEDSEEYSLSTEEDFLVARELSSVLLSNSTEQCFTPLACMRGLARRALSLYLDKPTEGFDISLATQIAKGEKLSVSQVQNLPEYLSSSLVQNWSNRILSTLKKPMSKKQEKKIELSNSVDIQATSSVELLSNGLLKIPVAKLGTWKHSQYGEVKFEEKDFEDIVNNFEGRVLGFQPYATYGHLVDQPVESIDAELKKGDAVSFQREDDVLFVLTQPKEDTLELVQKGEYEYSSGEFIRGYKDKVTGEDRGTVLVRYALTNAPFLPFDETKIEVLSNNNTAPNSPQSPVGFVIKLTSSSGDSSTTSILTEENQMQDNTTPETPAVSSTQEVVQPVVEAADIKTATVANAVAATVENPAPVSSNQGFDVNKLVEQLKGLYEGQFTALKTQYESQIEAIKTQSQQAVESLKSEIGGLQSKLESQTAVTQAFSNSLSAQQKKERYGALAAKGMPPVLIQKFSEIESAIESGSKVIKLSNSAGESVESSLADSIRDLVMDALQSEPLHVEQLGQTVSLANASGLAAELSALVTKNREAAKKA